MNSLCMSFLEHNEKTVHLTHLVMCLEGGKYEGMV